MIAEKAPWLNYKNLVVTFFSIFFALEMFGQHYNELTWTYLMLLVAFLNILVLFQKNIFLPPKKVLYFLAFSIALTAIQSLLNGSNLLEERWITRYMTFLTVFSFFQLDFEQDILVLISWPILVFFSALSGWSLYQYIFTYTSESQYALSTFGSRLWNISYYAQAISIALPIISYLIAKKKTKNFFYLGNAVTFVMMVTLFASQSRASLFGLALFIIFELFRPLGFSRKWILILLFFAYFTNEGIWHYKTANVTPTNINKSESLSFRKNIIEAVIEMSKEFPTGIGPDRLKSMLDLYYDSKKPFSGVYANITKSPHSEPLQVLVEDGWAIFIIYTIALLSGLVFCVKLFFIDSKKFAFSRFFICLLPQIMTHFPFDLYIPVLLFGLSLTQSTKSYLTKTCNPRILKFSLPLFSIFLLFIFCARQYGLPTMKYAVPYCEIFHDDFDVCKIYFKKAYQDQDYVKADQINRPLVKYQPLFYGSLELDYALGPEARSKLTACLFYTLYNGDHFIEGSDVKMCSLVPDRQKKLELFNKYAETR